MNGTRRVLVVDDEAKIAELLKEYLEEIGCQVDAATNGARAVKLIGSREYDAVVTDLWMQGVSGLDVVKALAESHPHREAIVVSAYATEAMREKMTAIGAYAVLDKPLSLQELGGAVEAACASDRLSRLAAAKLPSEPDVALARVLFVGGSEGKGEPLAAQLAQRGFAVDAACGADEGVEMALGADYGLVIFSLDGAGAAAPGAISAISSACPDTTVVALAEAPDGPAARDAAGAGAEAVLRADLTPAELLAQATRFSMLSQARRRNAERRQALRAAAEARRPGLAKGLRTLRGLKGRIGRRAAMAMIAAAILVAVALGVLAGPLGSLVSRTARDASERVEKLDAALEKLERVEGQPWREGRRELERR